SHGPGRLFTRFVEPDAMVRVACRSVARDLAVDARPAGPCRLLALHDEHPGAFGENEAVAVPGERTRCAGRVVIAGVGHDAHHAEAGHHGCRDRGVRTAADDVVDDAELEVAIRVADRVGG